MFHLHCPKCGAWAVVPDLSDPDAALVCKCCPVDHHHGQAANACPGIGVGHPGTACHHPGDGATCQIKTPVGEACPGGHCSPDHPDCTVCRPIVITPLAGSVTVSGVGN